MIIHLKLFASMKDLCGFSEKDIKFDSPVDVNGLLQKLSDSFPELTDKKNTLLIAVNEDYSDHNTHLKDGDTVAIFPPVSGG